MNEEVRLTDIDENRYEFEGSEPTEDMRERIFVLNEGGFSVPLEIPNDAEDITNA